MRSKSLETLFSCVSNKHWDAKARVLLKKSAFLCYKPDLEASCVELEKAEDIPENVFNLTISRMKAYNSFPKYENKKSGLQESYKFLVRKSLLAEHPDDDNLH